MPPRRSSHGGDDRRQGRKSNATKLVAETSRDAAKGKAQSVSAMLSGQVGIPALSCPRPAASAFVADVAKWRAEDDEGKEQPQKQVKGGKVKYNMEEEKEFILVDVGSDANQEEYWVDKDGKQVDADSADAMHRRFRGVKGQLLIREYGEKEGGMWVNAGHVLALKFGKAAPSFSSVLGKRVLLSPSDSEDTNHEEVEEVPTSAQSAAATASSTVDEQTEQTRPDVGAGRKQALQSTRKKQKRRECKVKGHAFQPKWLEKYDWLRTEPDFTAAEWERRPLEAPAYMYCICCVQAAPRGGQKDVLTRKVPTSLRGDKIKSHYQNKPAHARAYVQWKQRQRAEQSSDMDAQEVEESDEALAALVRTIMVTVISQSALTMVKTLVRLQRANKCCIMESNTCTSKRGGVQQILHAAASLLRQEQTERLRNAKIYSLMGDGSTDRKTTEQEVIYVRYPMCKNWEVSLAGMCFVTEYFDLIEVDTSFSVDGKSFDARAILRSTYHTAFLQRGLATLSAEPEADDEIVNEEGNASLQNTNLCVGSSSLSQFHPTRIVSICLDGASVNLGEHSGVVALLKKEVPHIIGVHAVAHVLELGWADAVDGVQLISDMLLTNQEAYTHYSQSGKKRLTFEHCCEVLGEEGATLVSMHGIRWRESSYRGCVNLLKTWRARTTDLLEEASTAVGLDLKPLSAPELFEKKRFRKKTPDARGRNTIYVLVVKKFLGVEGGQEMFECQYQTRNREIEHLSKADILGYILDDNEKKEALISTAAGQLYQKMTSYGYVKTLHFWADLCAEGKVLSKTLQRSGVLLSDVTEGVEDCLKHIQKLQRSPGPWMRAFTADFDTVEERLDGIELTNIEEGEAEFNEALSVVCENVVENLNERFGKLVKDPIIRAACIFEHARWPSYETAPNDLEAHGEQEIALLLDHFAPLMKHLGGDPRKVPREWERLKVRVMRDPCLRSLKYRELYERLYNQFSDKTNGQHFYNVLLVSVIVQTLAVDTSTCERGFSLMNNLKTAKRSCMGSALLRILMAICCLGASWKDATRIPVSDIIEEWRATSTRGRYEGSVWKGDLFEENECEEDPLDVVVQRSSTESSKEAEAIDPASLFNWLGD